MEEKIVQLKISLKNTRPPIWRRVLVKSSISFYELHNTIQLSMGWSNYHLYEFQVGNYRIGIMDEEFEDYGFGITELIDSEEVSLEEMLSKGIKRFTYEYDFGDGWEHSIEIEKIVPFDSGTFYPVCIKGKMKCPPEDCGGIPGFYDLLEIARDKKHPEHREMMEWLGGEFDPYEFDIEQANNRLEEIENIMGDILDFEDEMFLDPNVNIVNKSSHKLPEYETEASAGMDLRANITEAITLKPLERSIVKTGLFIELPLGYEAQVRPRSGLAAKNGITVLNSPGTIDADYRGEIGVILVNLSNEEFTIENGERIAQLVVARHERIIWNEVDSLSETSRGAGGFGSTGTK